MRKKVGIIKRLFSLLLIFLLSINSFAAIVSDNDGSAFITKAEFDALKASFQAQIDTYNQSIDSKIDGAIASYLAGIKLSTSKDLPIFQYTYSGIPTQNKTYWAGSAYSYGPNSATQENGWALVCCQQSGKTSGSACLAGVPYNESVYTDRAISADGSNISSFQKYQLQLYGSYSIWSIEASGAGPSSLGIWCGSTNNAWGSCWQTFFTTLTSKDQAPQFNGGGGGAYAYWTTLGAQEMFADTDTDVMLSVVSDTNCYYVDNTDRGLSATTPISSKRIDSSLVAADIRNVVKNASTSTGYTKVTSINTSNGVSIPSDQVFTIAKAKKYRELVFSDLKNICPGNNRLGDGIAIAQCDKKQSTIKIDVKADKDCYVVFYLADAATADWGGKRTGWNDLTSWKVAANQLSAGVVKQITLPNDNKQYVFVACCPKTDSDTVSLTFDNCTQILEN